MKSIFRLLGLGMLLLMLSYCVLGWFSTFESLPPWQHWVWRTVYGLVGVACAIGAVRPCRSLGRRFKRGARDVGVAEK